jgi:meromycolic acid enoyl-[acyl-carrier-protein] reductase
VGILKGRRILVTGVLTDDSLAFGAARLAQEQGAEVALTGFGRGLSLTTRVARKLPAPVEVYELDVTVAEQAERVAAELEQRWGVLDGVVHAIGFAPESCLGKGVLPAGWQDVATAFEVSTYSLKVLAAAFAPLLSRATGGGSIVGFDFDATVAWPGYDWMGVAKAALESLARYLARDLGPSGIRVNLVAAGPVRTLAAKSIPGFEHFENVWDARAPLGWDVRDSEAVARACVALLSDWFPRTTGEIVHVDGGFHATGV